MDSAFERICSLVSEVTGRPVTGSGDQRKGLCPSHEDDQPSLSIRNTEPVGVTCFAGCSFQDITDALGVTARDYRNQSGKRTGPRASQTTPSVHQGSPAGREIARYPYTDPDGEILYYNVRFEPKEFRMAKADGQIGSLPKTTRRVPYNLPAVRRAVAAGQTVYWVEGEKDVATLAQRGLIGTTAAGGASAPMDPDWARWFQGADLVVVADNDEVGRTYARRVAKLLVDSTVRTQVVLPAVQAPKADITDHFDAGLGVDDLVPQPRWVRRTEFDFDQILNVPALQMKWLLNGLIPESSGVALLVGAPKAGKSWFCLQLYLAVSSGDFPAVFGWGDKVAPAPCLYLALEDNPERLSYRLGKMLGSTQVPPSVRRDSKIRIDLEELDHGGDRRIRDWLDTHPDARLVIVDVLAKVRGQGGDGNAYQADYHAINQLKDIADEYGVTFVVTHHDRKKKHDGDFFDQVSGTKGITGAADTVLYLKRDRGSDEGNIEISGRDIEEVRYELQFIKEDGRWEIIGVGEIESAGTRPDTAAPKKSVHDQLVEMISRQGAVTMDDATAAIGKDRSTITAAAKDSLSLAIRGDVIASRNGHAPP